MKLWKIKVKNKQFSQFEMEVEIFAPENASAYELFELASKAILEQTYVVSAKIAE